MSPRWLTIEKLVTELGGVCNARDEMIAQIDHQPAEVEESLREATRAVTAAVTVTDPLPSMADFSQQDDVVRIAWAAIAVAQDRVARLSVAVARSRALRDRAQDLQDHSSRLRLRLRNRRRPG